MKAIIYQILSRLVQKKPKGSIEIRNDGIVHRVYRSTAAHPMTPLISYICGCRTNRILGRRNEVSRV